MGSKIAKNTIHSHTKIKIPGMNQKIKILFQCQKALCTNA